jgi:hypothetical protein
VKSRCIFAALAAFAATDAIAFGGPDAVPTSGQRAAAARMQAGAGLLVRRGEVATLAASFGGVVVESPVEVLQDGKAGQRVLVRGSAWTMPLAARVTGPGALEPAR